MADSEQFNSNGYSQIKTKIITAKSNHSTTHINQYGTPKKNKYKNNYQYSIVHSNSRNLTKEYLATDVRPTNDPP